LAGWTERDVSFLSFQQLVFTNKTCAKLQLRLAPLVTKILRMSTSLNTDFGWPTQVEGMQLVGNLQIGHTKGIAPAPRTGFVEKEIQNCVYTSLNFQTCFDLLFLFATENITCCEDSVMVITTAMLYGAD